MTWKYSVMSKISGVCMWGIAMFVVSGGMSWYWWLSFKRVLVGMLGTMLSLFVLQKLWTLLRNVCMRLEAASTFGCTNASVVCGLPQKVYRGPSVVGSKVWNHHLAGPILLTNEELRQSQVFASWISTRCLLYSYYYMTSVVFSGICSDNQKKNNTLIHSWSSAHWINRRLLYTNKKCSPSDFLLPINTDDILLVPFIETPLQAIMSKIAFTKFGGFSIICYKPAWEWRTLYSSSELTK